MTATIPTPAALAKPWLSGFCNPSNDENSHGRCLGEHEGKPCRCGCHRAAALCDAARQIRRDADHLLTESLDDIGWEDTVRIAHELKMAKSAIAATEEFIAKHAGAQWPGPWRDEQTVDGVGRANPYRSKNTSWDNDDVVKKVVAARMKEAGGELPDPMDVVRWLTDTAHIDYWRIGKLKELGVDVDEHRHTTYGTVRLGIKSDDMVGQTTREVTS